MTKTGGRKLHKGWAVVIAVLLVLLAVLGAFGLGVRYQISRWENWYPDYEKQDISALLEKTDRTAEDYALLYAQTGLTAVGVEDTLAQENGRETVLKIQEHYFREITVYGRYVSPIMYQERTAERATLARLQDGDILVTASTVVSWWRYGHSALVVDGAGGLLVESIGVGSDSKYNATETFVYLPNFIVLRPKADKAVKAQVVSYARENLVGLPYFFTVGILSKKSPKKIKRTQCAHLVWYAYQKFGLDLDSNGGGLVLPQDIANSANVEIVQIFGFHPERLWK